jgi:neutral ceramidase
MRTMRRLFIPFVLVSLLRSDDVEQGVRQAKPSGLLAGVARVRIDPPLGMAKLNWGSQTHVEAEGIDAPGFVATALVLSDGKQKFAMVDVDQISVDGLEAAADEAAKLLSVPAEHVRLGASHTHAGPLLSLERGPSGADLSKYEGPYTKYRALVRERIVEAVRRANENLQPAHVGAAKGTGTININRRVRGTPASPPAVGRNPAGLVDRELAVMRIDDAEGRVMAVVVNFAAHGTVLGFENKLASPDWPGYLRKTVEEAFAGSLCLFFQGAAGNQGPVEGFTGDAEVAHRLGRILGHQAAALVEQIDTVQRAPKAEGFVESVAFQAKQPWRVAGPRASELKFGRLMVDLPRRTYTAAEIADMERRIVRARAQVAELQGETDEWKKYQAEARLRRFTNLLSKWKQPVLPGLVPVELRVLRIGRYAIVSMPGEPFAEIGLAYKKASPFDVTMFCGYSNGLGGDYLPVTPEYAHGGYEIERTPYGLGAAEKLMGQAGRLFGLVAR